MGCCDFMKNEISTAHSDETGEEGFEPPSAVLETVALPLNYSPKKSDLFNIPQGENRVNRICHPGEHEIINSNYNLRHNLKTW